MPLLPHVGSAYCLLGAAGAALGFRLFLLFNRDLLRWSKEDGSAFLPPCKSFFCHGSPLPPSCAADF